MRASNSIRRLAAASVLTVSLLAAGIAHAAGGGVDADGNIHLNFHFPFPPLPADIDRVQEQTHRASEILCDATEGKMRIGSMRISAAR